jgi:HSP20 family protein
MSTFIYMDPRYDTNSLIRGPYFRTFSDIFENEPEGNRRWYPALDMVEEKDRLVVRIEIPGVDPQSVDVDLQGDALTVSGERKHEHEEEERGRILKREHLYGRFHRTIPLPSHVDADKVQATCANGVMTVILPKTSDRPAHKIPVEIK